MPQLNNRAKKPKAHSGYRDYFDARGARQGPLVLRDGTSVEWPKGWDKEAARTWRKATGLERPW